MVLIFARHGETEFGKKGKFEGISDSPLTEKGKRQAQLLARFCRKNKVKKIYSSPLGRALKTAQKVAGTCGLKVNPINDLKEICYGRWEGKTKSSLSGLEIWKKREKNLFSFIHPGNFKQVKGESYQILFNRLRPFFKKLNKEKESAVAIIVHAGVVRAARKFFGKMDNKTFTTFRLPNYYAYVVESKNNKFTGKTIDFTKAGV